MKKFVLLLLVIPLVWFCIGRYKTIAKYTNAFIPNHCAKKQTMDGPFLFSFSPINGWTTEENIIQEEEEQIMYPPIAYSVLFRKPGSSVRFIIYPDYCLTPKEWMSAAPSVWPKYTTVHMNGIPWYVVKTGNSETYFTHANGFHYEFVGSDVFDVVDSFTL